MHDPSSCPVGPVAVVIKLGGAAITHKQQLETLNGEVLAVAARQLAELQAAIGPRFVVVHGAGSFGHHNAAAAGVAHGRESGSIAGCADLLRGFAATRASVTKLSQAVVAALLAHGVPAVAVSPCPTWTTRRRQVAADGCDGVAALLAAGLVPVLHGDAVLDLELGCTILSGDTLITRLCERFRPPYVAFLVRAMRSNAGQSSGLRHLQPRAAWGGCPSPLAEGPPPPAPSTPADQCAGHLQPPARGARSAADSTPARGYKGRAPCQRAARQRQRV